MLIRPFRLLLLFLLPTLLLSAGTVERTPDGKTRVTLVCWSIPDPAKTDTNSRAGYAVVKEFMRRYPQILAHKYKAKYEADPEKYGRFDWREDKVEIVLKRFSGITISGMSSDSGPLMAIAGGVAPDILYVNFRQADTYIQEGFLYPLDKPEDNYFIGLTPDEREFHGSRKGHAGHSAPRGRPTPVPYLGHAPGRTPQPRHPLPQRPTA